MLIEFPNTVYMAQRIYSYWTTLISCPNIRTYFPLWRIKKKTIECKRKVYQIGKETKNILCHGVKINVEF